MQALLSFEQSPPLAAPLRFFLSAPLFIVLAGVLLVVDGGALLGSRWSPATLAATHLLTIGFMLQVMLGALIQILPVVAGANLARPALVAALVHPAINLGALAMAAGFLFAEARWLQLAAALLGLGLAVFLGVAGRAVFRVPSTSPSIRGLKLALLALAATVGSGLFMLLVLAGGWPVALPGLANLHAGWGLAGWAGVLLAAVAYVVVPMFQLTPGYPARPAWWFPPATLAALLLSTLAVVVDAGWLNLIGRLLLAVVALAFIAQTLKLQAGRRRARPDATFRYWQLGLGATLAALLMLVVETLLPAGVVLPAEWTVLLGVLVLVGGFLPFIIGMLYKIVPFLLWFDLQHRSLPGKAVPAMNKLLDEPRMRGQLHSFFAAFALSTVSVAAPAWLAIPAGLALIVAGGWLAYNLLRAVLRHRDFRRAGESAKMPA